MRHRVLEQISFLPVSLERSKMKRTKSLFPLMHLLCASVFLTNCLTKPVSGETLSIDSPMTPPAWALMQRELLVAKTKACETFFDKYFDHRGYLKCVERWGGNDGPDDAIENINDWPLHAKYSQQCSKTRHHGNGARSSGAPLY